MLLPLDLHFHVRAACLNSKWCRSKLARRLQTVFSAVKRPKCKADHMHILARFCPYVDLQTNL